MPVTAIQICDVAVVVPLVIKWLGVADPNYPEGGTVAGGSPYTLTQIKKAIFQADYEICIMITNALDHPYREIFVTEETADLADGDLIPAHFGHHSRVELTNGATTVLGKQRPFERLKLIKENPTIYGSPDNLYAIHGGRIHFADADTTARLDIPNVQYDDTFTALQTPQPYQWGLIGLAIMKCAMPGTDYQHRSYWAQMAQMYVNEISAGNLSLPEPEQLERLET